MLIAVAMAASLPPAVLAAQAADAQELLAPRRLPLPRLGDNGPERAFAALAVAPNGHVAFTTGYDSDLRLVTVIDADGSVVGRAGRTGDAPGEFRAILRIFLTDGALFVFDAKGRMAEFSLQGDQRWTRFFSSSDLPVAIRGDSMDVFTGHPDMTRGYSVRRISLGMRYGRVLVYVESDTLRSLYRMASDPGRSALLAYVPFPDGFVLGNGSTYQFLRVDDRERAINRFGRSLSPLVLTGAEFERDVARRLAVATRPFRALDGSHITPRADERRIRAEAARPRAHFEPRKGGAHADHLGRLFTVIPLGDSTALDFFANDRFQGRVHVPCAGDGVVSAAQGAFLALICAAPREGHAEVELQLYRLR